MPNRPISETRSFSSRTVLKNRPRSAARPIGVRLAVSFAALILFGAVWNTVVFAADRGGKKNEPAVRPVLPEAEKLVLEELVPTKTLSRIDLLKTMMRTDRSLFLPEKWREYAFEEAELPLGGGRTTPSPYTIASMIERLDPKPDEKVLEIGTGSGYQTAILASLAKEIYTVESSSTLARRAADALKKGGYRNLKTKIGALEDGWPEAGPFDKIIVFCAAEKIPDSLADQLAEGGTMLLPLGPRFRQRLFLYTKNQGQLEEEPLTPVRLDSMPGKTPPEKAEVRGAEQENSDAEDKTAPKSAESPPILTDSFETADGDGAPDGWYRVRIARSKKDMTAPEGASCLVFDNLAPYKEQRRKAALERIERRKAGRPTVNDETAPPETTAESSSESTAEQTPELSRRARQRAEELTAEVRRDFAIDGRKIRRLDLSCQMEGANLASLVGKRGVSVMTLCFYDEEREFLGEAVVFALRTGETPWKEYRTEEFLVPKRAREGTIRIGLLDGIGILKIDQLEIKKH